MLSWLKRWMAYLLLPAGLVLIFIPVCTHRMGEAERDFLFLENSADLLAAEKPAAAQSPPTESDSLEEKLKWVNERRQQKALEASRAAEIVNSYGYPRIQPKDLVPYPALADAVRTLRRIWAGIPSRLNRQDTVPIEEWNAFKEAVGILDEDPAFQYERYIFRGHVKRESVSVPVEVKGLRTGCNVTGVLFLILGLLVLCGSYASPPGGGIRVGRRSAIIIWDACIMGVGAVFTWWFVEFVLAKSFQTATEWGEDFVVGMGVFWVVLVYPVLALNTTATALQSLWITSDTITLRGLFGANTVKWSEVESIHVSQVFSPRKVGAIPAPHRVMKILKISAKGLTLNVMEPPYASTKKEIISALMQHAPEAHKPRIEVASKEWLAYL